MGELEAEMKKEREAKAAQARLKAQQQALFDLDRMPGEEPQQAKAAAPACSSSSTSPLLGKGGGSPVARSDATPKAKTDNAAVFIPKSWHTAGQEPDLSPVNAQSDDTGVGGAVIESES